MEPVNQIERAAAEWAAKTDGGEMPADQESAFEAWLAADPRHLGAYLKVEAALARVTRLGPEIKTRQSEPAVVSLDDERRRRRKFILGGGALAASIALAIAGGAIWQANSFDAVYRTQIGEIRTVSLPDGSSMTLNTSTKMHVRYTPLGRDVALEGGEALFDVAKNKRRPFTVSADGVSIRAVGTSFSVRAADDQPLTVTVREGVVSIARAGFSGETRVGAGWRAQALPDGRVDTAPVQLSHELAWLDGRILFRNQTLASAVREFDRYSKLRIIVDDPAIAARTITGTYVATDPAGFANAVALFMDLQVQTDGAKVYLRQKKL